MIRPAFVACLLVLAGCYDDDSKTVDYFVNDAADRAATLARCETLDAADEDANCVNARTAESIAQSNENLDAAQRYFGD